MAENRNRPDRKTNTQLGRQLKHLIQLKSDKEGITIQLILEQMGKAAGIDETTVRNIVNADDNAGAIIGIGIPLRRIQGFAKVLNVSVNSLLDLLPKKARAITEFKNNK